MIVKGEVAQLNQHTSDPLLTILPTSPNLGNHTSGAHFSGHDVRVNTNPPSTVVFLAICANHMSKQFQLIGEGSGWGKSHNIVRPMMMEVNAGAEEMEHTVLMR